jgi:hypothetical protein
MSVTSKAPLAGAPAGRHEHRGDRDRLDPALRVDGLEAGRLAKSAAAPTLPGCAEMLLPASFQAR